MALVPRRGPARNPQDPVPPGEQVSEDTRRTAAERLRTLRPEPRRPPISAGRLWRRMLIVCVLVVAVVLVQRGRFQELSDRVFGPRIDWSNDYAMTTWLYGMIERRHLTKVSRACLLLNIHGGDPADATHLDVYERPTEACMGPTHNEVRLLPRLFGLLVDRQHGTVLTDRGSPDHYHKLPWS